MRQEETDSYPLRGTLAQSLLEEGLKQAQLAGHSQRDVAAQMGYKSSVVLSHMSLGRVPIPVDRAEVMARTLSIDPNTFLLAVLEQRYPSIDLRSLLNISYSSNRTVAKLEAVAGCSLDDLPSETRTMLEEVVAARSPRRRWLAPAELATMELVRAIRPQSLHSGLSDKDRHAVTEALLRR